MGREEGREGQGGRHYTDTPLDLSLYTAEVADLATFSLSRLLALQTSVALLRSLATLSWIRE